MRRPLAVLALCLLATPAFADGSVAVRATFIPEVSNEPLLKSIHYAGQMSARSSFTGTLVLGEVNGGQIGVSVHTESGPVRPTFFGRMGLIASMPIVSLGLGLEVRGGPFIASAELEAINGMIMVVNTGVGVRW